LLNFPGAAIVSAFFGSERLGPIGTLAHSAGVWWIVLFDMVMGSSPSHTRAVNLSALLHCAKRALRAHARAHPSARRPLVIIDHFDLALGYSSAGPHRPGDAATAAEAAAVRAMLRRMLAWAAALCFDEALADVCVCTAPKGRRRPPPPAVLSDAEEFGRQLAEWFG
jgi:hypothetical protein